MRERMERFASFPFSVSCVSQSSVDVLDNHSRRSRAERAPSPPATGEREAKVKGLSGTNISLGIHKAVLKGIKSFSQLFSEREDEDEEMELQIGHPTDVQHVAHIGLDEPGKGSLVETMGRAPELFSLTPLAIRQFDLAMNHA